PKDITKMIPIIKIPNKINKAFFIDFVLKVKFISIIIQNYTQRFAACSQWRCTNTKPLQI
ncbi:MAG: hypothetical protein KYX68_13275, partial [Flavobacterium sp.]|nr:hypothetical protein [Flavobacterium sp.]